MDGTAFGRAAGTTRRRLLGGALGGLLAGLAGGAASGRRKQKRDRTKGRRDWPTGPCRPTSDAVALEMLALVNAWRARNGVAPLVLDGLLLAAARTKAEALARTESHDHEVDGVGWWDNIANQGYPTEHGWLGENIVTGVSHAADALNLLRQSGAHNRNLLDPKFRAMGVAVAWNANSGPYWAQTFGDLVVAPASGC
jgi:uncharacterized protein YkwD